MANAITTVLLVLGTVLALDGLIFHWFGDMSWLDPYIHHWHLGVAMVVLALFFTIKPKGRIGLK